MTRQPQRLRRTAARIALALAAGLCAAAAPAKLVVMHGYADATSALVWIQADAPGPIAIAWRPEGAAAEQRVELAAERERENVVVALLDGLAPGGRASYRIAGDGDVREGAVRAQPRIDDPGDAPAITIAVGSCYFLSAADAPAERDRTFGDGYEIFDAIAAKRPDAMLWLGDNVYLRRHEYFDAAAMARRHRAQRAHPPLQRLLTATAHLAIWDDHDYGPNNADARYVLKDEALRLFRLYWANPSYGLPQVPGIFGRASVGDVDLVLLDGRYHRSPPQMAERPDKSMWGAAQAAWLRATLRELRGSVRLIANGSQFWNAASDHEGLYQYASEQKALADFLLAERIDGLLFLSGDRHFGELLRVERPLAYPLYEFTSSPLTSQPWEKPDARERGNPQVVRGTLVGKRQFGLVRVTGPLDDRRIALEAYDQKGELLWRHELRARDLRFPAAKAAS
jgi:alkaline phosphatase D